MPEAVATIAFSQDRKQVLLIQRRDIPVWVLPGGGIDPGETPEQAALREMEEETGYKTSIIRKVARYSPRNRLSRPTHFFEVVIVSGKPTTGAETKDVRFFPIEELPRHLSPPYSYWIRDALSNSEDLIQKPVEGTSYWVLLKLLIQHPIWVSRFLFRKLKSSS